MSLDRDKTAAVVEKLQEALEASPRSVPILIEVAIAMLLDGNALDDRDSPAFRRGYSAGHSQAKVESLARSDVRPEYQAFAVAYEGKIQRMFTDPVLARKFSVVASGELIPMIGHRGRR